MQEILHIDRIGQYLITDTKTKQMVNRRKMKNMTSKSTKSFGTLSRIIGIFALLILWMGLLGSATIFAAVTGTVKGSAINVRSDAGTGYAKVTSVSAGDITIVTGKKKDVTGKYWYQVSFTKDGKEYKGFVIEDYLTVTEDVAEITDTTSPSATPAPSQVTKVKQATVTATSVNIRNKAVTGAVIGKVSVGDIVYLIKAKKGSDGYKWHNITFVANGKPQKGWIRSDFIKVGKKITVDTGSTDTAATPSPAPTAIPDAKTPNRSTIRTMTPDMPGIVKAATHYATIKGNNVSIRKKAPNGKVIATLKKGDYVGAIRSKQVADGSKWYYISFSYFDQTIKGWVKSDYLQIRKKISRVDEIDASSSNEDAKPQLSQAEFETYIVQQGFPEDYKPALRALHEKYPKWTFRAVQTGLSWPDVMTAETKVGQNLVSKTAVASWKSTATAAYDYRKDIWYTFDGGSWVAASDALVAYHLDPRNFLDENSIFQFESLEYEKYQVASGVKELLKDSFMKDTYVEPDGSVKSYADSFVEIGQQVGVSPYHLAARCYQEQGAGKSASISGTVPGYLNIFNYYNIGAYASGQNSPTTQGLIYASSSTTTASLNYDRPWNTRYKSLLGGAKYVSEKYVKLGQNTLYFQKFNVVNSKSGFYKHQYMTNVQAAASEALKMSKAYVDKNTELVFYIPVYTNMPAAKSEKPTHNANPNNYLASLNVGDYTLRPVFGGNVDNYYLTVPNDVAQVVVSATPVANTSTVLGCGTVPLLQGLNDVLVQCVSQSGEAKSYLIHITRE